MSRVSNAEWRMPNGKRPAPSWLFPARLRASPLLPWLLAAALAAGASAGETYRSVMRSLSAHEQRLPGSPQFAASADALEAALRAGGLEPHRQTFDTLAPETRVCRLSVDGEEVAPVYALGPNGSANNTAGGQPLSGPLVWLGQGTLEEMRGKPVEGSIAVLAFDSPNMAQVFSQGALAVVFVGRGRETQWDVRRQFREIDAALPRLFVPGDAADRHGLTSGQPGRQARVALATVWKDVQGVNLWTVLPGGKGAGSGAEEAVVLSATLDTFGAVPGLCPGTRAAANCALLAEVAVALAKQPLERDVCVVFLGSHYGLQDGARLFYHAARGGERGEFEARAGKYREQVDSLSARAELLQRADLFGGAHPALFEVTKALDKRLAAQVSGLNFELSAVRRVRAAQRRAKETAPADAAALAAEESRLAARRTALNDLRRQLHHKAIADPATYAGVAAAERAWLARGIEDYRRLLAHNAGNEALHRRIGGKRLVGHYGFDFANATDDWTLSINGIGAQMFYHSLNRKFAQIKTGDFVRNVRDLAALEAGLERGEGGPALFAEPVLALQQPDRFCVPSIRSVPARVAHAVQVFGYQMMTVADPLDGDELPYRQEVDLEALAPRLTAFARGLATAPELSQACPLAESVFTPDTVLHFRGEGGMRYLNQVRGSTDVEGVPTNGVVFCAPMNTWEMPAIAGHTYNSASRILASGNIYMPMMFHNVRLRPLGFDGSGALELLPAASGGWSTRRMFYGHGGIFFLPLVPGKFGPSSCTLAEAGSDSAFRDSYVQSHSGGLLFYADENSPFKAFANGGLLLLNGDGQNPQGAGVRLEQPPLYALNALRQTAHDYALLNESRLRILREKSIINDSLETLQADAAEHWEAAVEARGRRDVPGAVAHETFAAALGARVAVPLREVTNDMIRAVVLLLLLTIPFAFALERLLLNGLTIYRQVLGFAAFFVGTFVLLYLAHPAFALASSPLIIFLAFVIILLSVVVMAIVMSKFKRELRAIQGLSTSAHGVSADSSTALSAVLIGISGMRNRPLKTFLTALTIIMLTFTIVVFASFTSAIGVKASYLGKGEGPNRIELRRFSGLAIPGTLLDALQTLYGKDWTICAREGLFRSPTSETEGQVVAFRKENRKWEPLKAMVGLDPAELAQNPPLARAVPGLAAWAAAEHRPGEYPLFLHPRVAGTLEAAPGQTITIGGRAFTFAGTFDAVALDQLAYMDRAKFTPPDFEGSVREVEASTAAKDAGDPGQESAVDTTRFTYFPARDIGITVRGGLAGLESDRLASFVSAVVMYARPEADVEAAARDIAKVFVGPVTAKGSSGANRFFFSRSMQASGFAMLIVPLLLGGLIIFNSLLGSIVDRQKEIFTYSALGLAPPDVGALFFAESGVYAVLGGMGGYLLSQVVAKLVNLGGERGWFVPPEMNFSSLASVLTILVVMAMVMVSTIYPALKAGRSANPGVARRWKMPRPEGDRVQFVFPFTVSARDMGGILAFVAEHFGNHGDSSLGSFAAGGVALFRREGGGAAGLRANVSLAPFDLGVMQAMAMYSRPSEIEGIDEVVVELQRVSGTRAAWMRGNRVFINELRQQFLLWRSLPVTTVEQYRAQGQAQCGAGEGSAEA